MAARRKFWGWGLEGQGPNEEQAKGITRTLEEHFGTELSMRPEPRLADITLPEPRIDPPASLADICTDDPHDYFRMREF